jgi:hypothetical protein
MLAAAGDLLAGVCSGEVDDSSVSMRVWTEPLMLHCRLGVKLANDIVIFTQRSLRRYQPIGKQTSAGAAQAGSANGTTEESSEEEEESTDIFFLNAIADLDALLAGPQQPLAAHRGSSKRARKAAAAAAASVAAQREAQQATAGTTPTFIGRHAGLHRPSSKKGKAAAERKGAGKAAPPATKQQPDAAMPQRGTQLGAPQGNAQPADAQGHDTQLAAAMQHLNAQPPLRDRLSGSDIERAMPTETAAASEEAAVSLGSPKDTTQQTRRRGSMACSMKGELPEPVGSPQAAEELLTATAESSALSSSDAEAGHGAAEAGAADCSRARPCSALPAAPQRLAKAHALLAASRLGRGTLGRSLVDIWQESCQVSRCILQVCMRLYTP